MMDTERTKEEIGWLKHIMVFLFTSGISLAGWAMNSLWILFMGESIHYLKDLDRSQLWIILFALVAALTLFVSMMVVNIRIKAKISKLGKCR